MVNLAAVCIRYLNSLLFVLETVELALLDHEFGLELTRVGADVTSEHRLASFNRRARVLL